MHESVVKESGCKGNNSGLESSITPGELYMNTNSTFINEDSAKTGLTLRRIP